MTGNVACVNNYPDVQGGASEAPRNEEAYEAWIPEEPGPGPGPGPGPEPEPEPDPDPDPDPGHREPEWPPNPHDDLEAELKAQQNELAAEEAHLATVTDPAERQVIEGRIADRKRQIADIEAKLGGR